MFQRIPSTAINRLVLPLVGLWLGACAMTVPAGMPRPIGIQPIVGITLFALSQYDAALVLISVPKDCERNADPVHPIVGELVDVQPVLVVPSTLNLATLPGAAVLRVNGIVTLDWLSSSTLRMSVNTAVGGRSLTIGRLDMMNLGGGPLTGEIRLPGGTADGDLLLIYVENGP
jgi:hypothetical protein